MSKNPSYSSIAFLVSLYAQRISAYRAIGLAGQRRFFKRGLFELPADIASYRRGHNSVEEVSFQLSRDLPQQPLPLYVQLTGGDLQKLVEQNSNATLQELCELVQKQRGIKISTTAICRLMKRHNIRRRRKPQVIPLAVAA